MTLKQILPLVTATVALGAVAAPVSQAALLSAAPAPPTAAGISCQHVVGSQYICRVTHTFGSSDYHCDMKAKICKPL